MIKNDTVINMYKSNNLFNAVPYKKCTWYEFTNTFLSKGTNK